MTEPPFEQYAFLVADFTMTGGREMRLEPPDVLRAHPLLAPSVVKLQWARRHLAALEHNISETFRDPANQAVLNAHLDLQSGYHVFRVACVPEVAGFADFFTNSVADVAKNLHPALDQLAWQLACAEAPGGEPLDPIGVKFPICDQAADETTRSVLRARKQIRADHWSFIQEFQPHKGVNGWQDSWSGEYVHPLSLLRDLANDDKHRLSQPTLIVPTKLTFRGIRFARRSDGPQWAHLAVIEADDEVGTMPAHYTDGTVNDWYLTGLGKPLKLGLEVMRARLSRPPDPEIDNAGTAPPQVVLYGGRFALETLQRIERFVHLILSEFARQFPA